LGCLFAFGPRASLFPQGELRECAPIQDAAKIAPKGHAKSGKSENPPRLSAEANP